MLEAMAASNESGFKVKWITYLVFHAGWQNWFITTVHRSII